MSHISALRIYFDKYFDCDRALADTAVFPVRRSYPGPDIATVHRADDTERFHFRESDEPEGLELDAVTGVISRGDDHEWPTDNTSISFMVDVTAEGDDQGKSRATTQQTPHVDPVVV